MATATVTVLFTDLVGSTELLARLGEDRAEELRREHFRLLREVVESSGGREVKNLGDGVMVVFQSVTSGLRCAVEMQQSIETRNRSREPLLVRVGVSMGETDVEGGDFFGIPVVEAARLCGTAQGGEILTTEVVRVLAGTRGGLEFEPLGSLELKGLPAAVSSCRVAWAPRADVGDIDIPLSWRVGASSSATFVGRAVEHARLHDAAKAALAGERRVVLVGGEPGIGKTSLAAQFGRQMFDEGFVVLYGHCDEGLGILYQPWNEALTHLVLNAPRRLLNAHINVRGVELARLVPELAEQTSLAVAPSADAESERSLLFGAVVDLLARVSAVAPVVIVLDDLHWADRSTIELLQHVVAADRVLRVLVIGTFRDSEIALGHPLADALAALRREQGVERMPLRGLADDELLALLETNAGHELTEQGLALRDALTAETEGNPFFVGEILRHLAETHALYRDESGWWVTSADLRAEGLPVSVREVIGHRVARLGEDTRRVLALAAVIGREFDVDLLSRIVDISDATLADLCDRAVDAAILTEGEVAGRFAFTHALFEHTLYEGLSATRRARAHRAVAESLEDLCGDDPGERIGELAYHWARATRPQDATKAIMYAQRAGDRALEQLAPDEALRWYGDALELLERSPLSDDRRRAALLTGLGTAQRERGDAAHRRTLLDAAQVADRTDDVHSLVRSALANNRGWNSVYGGVDGERVAVLRRALERVGHDNSPERARLLALLALETYYSVPLEERVALAKEAVATARETGDRRTLCETLARTHEAISAAQTLDLRVRWTREACEIADAIGEPRVRAAAHTPRMLSALEAADGAAVRHAASVTLSAAEQLDLPFLRWNVTFHASWLFALDGDVAAAERVAEEALNLGLASGQNDAIVVYGAQLMSYRWMQGRLDEMVQVVDDAAAQNPGLDVLRASACWTRAYAGLDAEVSTRLDLELRNGFALYEDQHWLTAVTLFADAAAIVRHREAATFLRESLRPWHNLCPTTHITFSPVVAQYLGLLAHRLEELDEADGWFAEALTLHQRLNAPLQVAWTQSTWAELLADRDGPGDIDRARPMAEEALSVASRRGYGFVESHASRVLQRLAT